MGEKIKKKHLTWERGKKLELLSFEKNINKQQQAAVSMVQSKTKAPIVNKSLMEKIVAFFSSDEELVAPAKQDNYQQGQRNKNQQNQK